MYDRVVPVINGLELEFVDLRGVHGVRGDFNAVRLPRGPLTEHDNQTTRLYKRGLIRGQRLVEAIAPCFWLIY